jgi:hypothetical protein
MFSPVLKSAVFEGYYRATDSDSIGYRIVVSPFHPYARVCPIPQDVLDVG